MGVDASQIAAVILCVLEKRDKIADTDYVYSRLEPVAEMDSAGQNHVAAVAPAEYGDTLLIEIWLRTDPVEERADVTN